MMGYGKDRENVVDQTATLYCVLHVLAPLSILGVTIQNINGQCLLL